MDRTSCIRGIETSMVARVTDGLTAAGRGVLEPELSRPIRRRCIDNNPRQREFRQADHGGL